MGVEVRLGRSIGRDSPTGSWKRQEYGTVQNPGRGRRLAGTGSCDGGGDMSMGGDSLAGTWEGEGPGEVQEPERGHKRGRAGDITTGTLEGQEYSTGQGPGD